MSNYIGYKEEDNIKRKSNNVSSEVYELVGKNINAKQYTTNGSALTKHLQEVEAKIQKEKSIKSLKVWTKEEIEQLNN